MFVFLKTTRERFDTGKFDYSREQKSSLLLPYFQLGKVILKVKKKKKVRPVLNVLLHIRTLTVYNNNIFDNCL